MTGENIILFMALFSSRAFNLPYLILTRHHAIRIILTPEKLSTHTPLTYLLDSAILEVENTLTPEWVAEPVAVSAKK